MVKPVEMTRLTGTAKSFTLDSVTDGYIRISGGTISLGRRCANRRRDELSVSLVDIKAAIEEAENAGGVDDA